MSNIEAIVLTPITGTGAPGVDDYRPLLMDEYALDGGSDLTMRNPSDGIPSVNLYVIKCTLSGQELAKVKSDNRFFVLSPGPGNTGSALTNWLASKGATGHGVTNSDNADQATAKLRDWCRDLP